MPCQGLKRWNSIQFNIGDFSIFPDVKKNCPNPIKSFGRKFRGARNLRSFLNKLTDRFAWSTTIVRDPKCS